MTGGAMARASCAVVRRGVNGSTRLSAKTIQSRLDCSAHGRTCFTTTREDGSRASRSPTGESSRRERAQSRRAPPPLIIYASHTDFERTTSCQSCAGGRIGVTSS